LAPSVAGSNGHYNNISIFVWLMAIIWLLHLRKFIPFIPIFFFPKSSLNISSTAHSNTLLPYKLAMDGLQCKLMSFFI